MLAKGCKKGDEVSMLYTKCSIRHTEVLRLLEIIDKECTSTLPSSAEQVFLLNPT